MKKLVFILLLYPMLLFPQYNRSNPSTFEWIQEDKTQIGIFIDPTFTDSGIQIGTEITKIMYWGFISASISRYEDTTKYRIDYTDLVFSGGINWKMFEYEPIRYYLGPRGGFIYRDGEIYGLYGLGGGFDWRLTKWTKSTSINIGIRLWTDYRDDQHDKWLGDDDAYERGLITNNPLVQENGAVVLSITW